MKRVLAKSIVSLVSGFYGNGCWTAWCMLVASTIVDKLFTVEQNAADKNSHIYGLDINLVGSFTYPFIAAIDLLLHMHHFFNNGAVQDVDIASIDASLVVLREGLVFGFSCCSLVLSAPENQDTKIPAWSIFDLGYCQFGWQSYIDGWVMMPYHRVFDKPQSTLAAKYPSFARAIRNTNNGQEGPPFWAIGLFIHTNLVAEIVCKAFMLRLDLIGIWIRFFRGVARLRKQAKTANLQRQIRKQTESHRETAPVTSTPDNSESNRAITERQSDIELGGMSHNGDLEAQSMLQPEYRSNRLRTSHIAEPERPRRPQTLVSTVLISWLSAMEGIQPTSLYLCIKLTDTVRGMFVTGPPIDWTALGVSNIPPLSTILTDPLLMYVLRGTVMWQMPRALADIVLTFAMMISHIGWMIPTTEAKFKDLDQMGAFITAGVLPLVYSIGTVLCNRFEIGEKVKDRLLAAAVKKGKGRDLRRNF